MKFEDKNIVVFDFHLPSQVCNLDKSGTFDLRVL